jgi:O-antigen/teichoic acid export membrane protein
MHYYHKIKTFALSGTAKDTYLLFFSNTLSAFTGFLFTVIVARELSVADNGVYSAANNLILIIASLTDVGISAGLTNYVARYYASGEDAKANEYIKAGFLIRLLVVSVLAFFILIFAGQVSQKLLATSDPSVATWVAIISLILFSWIFFPFIFKAKRQFFKSAVIENVVGIFRIIFGGALLFTGLSLSKVFSSYALAALIDLIVIFLLIRTQFLKSHPKKTVYKNLLNFSGWIGVNNILSSISGRLDVQMLAAIAGATATGLYSVPQRLSLFIGVLASSFSSVLSPRMAAFSDKEKEKKYMLKATVSLIPISIVIIAWVIIAKPFILILFGEKYLAAVPIFQVMASAMILFLFCVPPVGAIIYAMQKPIYIGVFAIFQIIFVFLLDTLLIPKYGAFGPTYTLVAINFLSLIYFWTIAVRYYWRKSKV